MSPTRIRKQKYLKSSIQDKGQNNNSQNMQISRLHFVAGILAVLLICGIVLYSGVFKYETQQIERKNLGRVNHRESPVTSRELEILLNRVDIDRLWNILLKPILIPRRPDTKNITTVKHHIHRTLYNLQDWNVEFDTFHNSTPFRKTKFSNIIASTNPNAERKLVLACHYDSKDMTREGYKFIGATDSAVPCAMLLEIATVLDVPLKDHTRKQLTGEASALDVSLDLLFFDGEEAFLEWTEADSLYGSRHLARKWSNLNGKNVLEDIDLFVLLDLIGHAEASFVDFNHLRTTRWFNLARAIENRLKRERLLNHTRNVFYRHGQYERYPVEDDHIPFLRNGVPILHLISMPFPRVWHSPEDNVDALNRDRIEVITKILTIFVAEYLHLKLPIA